MAGAMGTRSRDSLFITSQLQSEWQRAGINFRVMLVGESGTLRLSKAPEQQQRPPYQTRGWPAAATSPPLAVPPLPVPSCPSIPTAAFLLPPATLPRRPRKEHLHPRALPAVCAGQRAVCERRGGEGGAARADDRDPRGCLHRGERRLSDRVFGRLPPGYSVREIGRDDARLHEIRLSTAPATATLSTRPSGSTPSSGS